MCQEFGSLQDTIRRFHYIFPCTFFQCTAVPNGTAALTSQSHIDLNFLVKYSRACGLPLGKREGGPIKCRKRRKPAPMHTHIMIK